MPNKRDLSKLRGRIVEKYGTMGKFAEHIEMSAQTLSNKFSGRIGITNSDILEWCQALDIEKCEIGDYFFTFKV